MKNAILSISSFLIIALSITACGPKVAAWSPAGTWNVTVKGTPDGDVKTKMLITKKGDQYEGALVSDGQSTPMKELTIDGKNIRSNFSYMGYSVDMQGVFEGDTYAGKVSVEGMDFPMSGAREVLPVK